ncbi:hypothetical protein SELMODRAFT_143762 [Selaginella moellendorffii]|uniref:Uncharacterized protein n=1 Tax=Selaginella moellendorffii TaxID=88036 RepID=D8R5K1_SELML|nr:uncharacterized protein LOC9652229 [Selaginella moellendorffii]EFJ32164.1 hypothetical protein SELMODRAFT_143762 [Selaginella moellendorffii]|eukprot:XP_002966137.1 uncharacterized protein LOC9652229 [Selaginella moellendorffii]
MADQFRLVSPGGFHHEGKIPRKHTGDGQGDQKDISPALEWYNVPEGTVSLALVVDDPDAPDPKDPVVPWVHWVLINIPPTLKGIPAGFTTKGLDEKSEFAEIQEGYNDWKLPGYRGPNPPVGTHRYVFKLYALDTKLKLGHKATKDKVEIAVQGHVLGETELIGHYTKENFSTGHDSYVPPPGGPLI